MWAIYKKEIGSFYRSMMGYLYTAFFLLIAGVFFTAFNLQGGVAEFGYVLGNTMMVLLVVIPVLTMRTLGGEQRQKTDQLLFTAPVKISSIVLGKFFAVLTVFAIPLLVLTLCPLVLSRYGTIPLAQSYSSFLAFLYGSRVHFHRHFCFQSHGKPDCGGSCHFCTAASQLPDKRHWRHYKGQCHRKRDFPVHWLAVPVPEVL